MPIIADCSALYKHWQNFFVYKRRKQVYNFNRGDLLPIRLECDFMKLIIKNDYNEMSAWAAQHIADAINNHKENRPFVLGLPTGSSPLGVYRRLIEMNKQGLVTFKNVVTFNMDEYVGLPREHDQSYWYFMHDNFFNHIDIPAENINILDGMAEDLCKKIILRFCAFVNKKILPAFPRKDFIFSLLC